MKSKVTENTYPDITPTTQCLDYPKLIKRIKITVDVKLGIENTSSENIRPF